MTHNRDESTKNVVSFWNMCISTFTCKTSVRIANLRARAWTRIPPKYEAALIPIQLQYLWALRVYNSWLIHTFHMTWTSHQMCVKIFLHEWAMPHMNRKYDYRSRWIWYHRFLYDVSWLLLWRTLCDTFHSEKPFLHGLSSSAENKKK
jgi:hypothetical protein